MDIPVDTAPDETWCSIKEAQRILGVSRQRVAQLVNKGRIKARVISTWPTPTGCSSVRLINVESAIAYSRSR